VLSSGADLIATERRRQIEVEGWDAANDAGNDEQEMVYGASAYLQSVMHPHHHPNMKRDFILNMYWPRQWNPAWFKPTTPIRDLVKAGALIAAEIDRLQRIEAQGS
jgi:hypothetical protein